MAFFSKVGNILKQSVSKQISSQFSASNPSIYEALRCMSSSRLYVGGIPFSVDDTSLREAFASYGEVTEARVIVDREQNRSKGFGFVTFTSSEEASSAIQAMDGQDMQGRRLKVNYAIDRVPRLGGFGGGYGGYGGGGYGGGQNYSSGGDGYGGGGYGGRQNYDVGYDGGQNYGGGDGYGGGGNHGDGGGYGGGQNYGGGGGYGGGQNYRNSGGYSTGGQETATDGGFARGTYGVPGGVGGSDSYFGGSAAVNNVTAETGSGSNRLDYSSADQFGNNLNGGFNGDIGNFESKGPLEENFKDDEPNDFAKKA